MISARIRLVLCLAALGLLSACIDTAPDRLQDDRAVLAPGVAAPEGA
jgi:hypothetical protein